MSYLKTSSTENNKPIKLYYEQHGKGQPVILIHGWPLSAQMWEYQIQEIVKAGYQVVAYDRRGFGRSDKPYSGYDYNTLATDLNDLIHELNLKEAILIGFSMGGGEVARYIGNYGTGKLDKAALVSSVCPFMMKTNDNPNGVPEKVFTQFKEAVKKDRPAFLEDFGNNFVNFEDNKDKISEALVHFNWTIAVNASAKATLDCIDSFGKTDFRGDMAKFKLPTLIVHGDADEVVPLDVSAKQAEKLAPKSQLEVISGAPHGLVFTHTKEFNKILIDFLNK